MSHPMNHAELPVAGSTPPHVGAPPPDSFPPPAYQPGPSLEELAPSSVKANRKVLFNLDALENESTAEPFVFEYQGSQFELLDPKDIDWQDLMIAQETPRLMLHIIMPEEQLPAFLEMKLPMRKLEALLKRWQDHFGLPSAGEAEGSAPS